jgi:hypothetical protein
MIQDLVVSGQGNKMVSVDSLELKRKSGPSGDERWIGEFVQGRERETGDGDRCIG